MGIISCVRAYRGENLDGSTPSATAHIGPLLDSPGVSVVVGENLVIAKFDSPVGKVKVAPGGKRGVVSEFSPASRSRLAKKVNCLGGRLGFVTLTYPYCFPGASEAKQELRAFFKKCKRKYPQFGAIWKFEYQKRGAPHFHLFVFGVPYPEMARLRIFWFENAKKYVPSHKRVQDCFKYCFDFDSVDGKGARIYLTKYISKGDKVVSHEGRFWGCEGKIPLFKICRFLEKDWREFFTLLEERLFELGLEHLRMNQSWYIDPGEKIFKFLLEVK